MCDVVPRVVLNQLPASRNFSNNFIAGTSLPLWIWEVPKYCLLNCILKLVVTLFQAVHQLMMLPII